MTIGIERVIGTIYPKLERPPAEETLTRIAMKIEELEIHRALALDILNVSTDVLRRLFALRVLAKPASEEISMQNYAYLSHFGYPNDLFQSSGGRVVVDVESNLRITTA